MPVVMDADRIGRTLTRIAHEILERIDSSLSEIVGADKFEPGSFVAPPT